jgi:hypothetical protein
LQPKSYHMSTVFKSECKSSLVIRIITFSFGLLAMALIAGSFYYITNSIEENIYYALAIILLDLFVLVIIIFLFLNRPKNVMVDSKYLLINFPTKTLRIELDKIVEARKINRVPVFRIGSKGFFGFIGVTIDGSKCFITDPSNTFYLKTSNEKGYYFSCENVERIIPYVSRSIETTAKGL